MYCLVLLSALLACAAGVPLNSTKPKPNERIVGGHYYYPVSYQVSLHYQNSYRCVGSIISLKWVLTAASCVVMDGYYTVRAGGNTPYDGGTLYGVARIIKHEKFNVYTFDYDIALVQVNPAFTTGIYVQLIPLECDPVPVGIDVDVSGFGAYSEGGAYGNMVNFAFVRVISDSYCNSTYVPWRGITDRMICAGDPDAIIGPCEGDWGAPLRTSGVVGVYSWSVGCGRPQYPGVYTKVSAVCDWIVTNADL